MALNPLPAPAPEPQRARRLHDAELLRTEFRYVSPETSIEGLNRGVPDADAHPVIIGYYDEKPAGGRKANPDYPFVWCCHCGKRTHWDGLVVRDDRGETYIIGASVCGRAHYGDRFGDAERVFKSERQRRRTLRAWHNAFPLARSIKADIEQALAWPGLATLEMKRDQIRAASEPGYQKLLRYCTTGTEMVAHREVRDHAAEAERERRYSLALAAHRRLPPDLRREARDNGDAPEEDTTPIYVRTSEPLGYLLGGDFLRPDCDPRARAVELAKTVAAIEAIGLDGTDEVDTSRLSELLKRLSDGSTELQTALHNVSFSDLFFSPANLDRLERWSAQEARFGYANDDGVLLVRDSSRGQSRIEPMGDIAAPRSRTIDMMRHLDENFELPEPSDNEDASNER